MAGLERELPTQAELDACPFCEGREDRTPPESLALPERQPPDTPGWLVRVVPNLYPAFAQQDVVVHAPRHVRSLAELSDTELALVAAAWRARAAAAHDAGFGYVHALINEGRSAGASLAHSHSQLVWMSSEPPVVTKERGAACRLCALLEAELAQGDRGLETREAISVLAHPAGRVPYELLIAPREHDESGLQSPLLSDALASLAYWVRRLRRLEGPVPLNAWLHAAGHWHIELVPRLSVLAGIELGAGIYVNTLPPEEAAKRLRAN